MEINTQPRVTTSSVAVRYGVLTGIVAIIFSFLMMVTGQMGNTTLGYLSALIFIGGIVLAQRAFRASNGGFMSYGEGLGIGVLVSLVSGLFSTLFGYVYREFVDPTVTQQMTDQLRTKFEQAGNMSDEQIDQAIAMTQKFSTGPIGIVIGLVSALVMGLILSLVISAIMKRTRPEFE